MTIPKEAISLENYKRAEKGLPPIPKPKVVRTDPTPPVVPDQIAFKDIPDDEIFEFNARSYTFKNEAGTRFTGYTIFLESRKGKIFEGWMPEGEFIKLKQRIQVEAPALLLKIGL